MAVGSLAEQALTDPRAGLVVGWAAPSRTELGPALAVLTEVLADVPTEVPAAVPTTAPAGVPAGVRR